MGLLVWLVYQIVYSSYWMGMKLSKWLVMLHLIVLVCNEWIHHWIITLTLSHGVHKHHRVAEVVSVVLLACWCLATVHDHWVICKVVVHWLIWRYGLYAVSVVHVSHVWIEHIHFLRRIGHHLVASEVVALTIMNTRWNHEFILLMTLLLMWCLTYYLRWLLLYFLLLLERLQTVWCESNSCVDVVSYLWGWLMCW